MQQVSRRNSDARSISIDEPSSAPASDYVANIVAKHRGGDRDNCYAGKVQLACGGKKRRREQYGFTGQWKSERLGADYGKQHEVPVFRQVDMYQPRSHIPTVVKLVPGSWVLFMAIRKSFSPEAWANNLLVAPVLAEYFGGALSLSNRSFSDP